MRRKTLLLMLLMALFSSGAWAQTAYTNYTLDGGAVLGSNCYQGADDTNYGYLIDNNLNSGHKFCVVYRYDTWYGDVYVDFHSAEPIIPKGYVLYTGDDTQNNPNRRPKAWKIEAKLNSSDSWTELTSKDNANLSTTNNAANTFNEISGNTTAYQYFRFRITAVMNEGIVELQDFHFNATVPGGGDTPSGDETCEDFESVTGTAYNIAGSMPSGWYSYTTATGDNIVAPHVTSGSYYNYYHGGSQSVNMESGTNATSSGNYAYVVLPLYNNVTQLKYWSKRESTSYGTLKLGYVDAQTSTACNNFTTLATVTPNTTNTEYTIDFENNYTLPAGKYIAFQWNTNGSYYACCIDDVCVTTAAGTAPASLPYTENFENGQNGWEFGNGTQTNYWMVGSNTSYNSSNSLYITNNGSANAYSTGNTSYVYAYRKLNVPSTGDYVVSFKWKANGESSYDLLRAFMIPASVNPTLTGGSANGQSSSTNTTPTGWIDVANPSGKLNLQTSWQSSVKNVSLSTAGVYYLVFFWKNDGSGGTTPPAAVDNIDVHEAPTYTITATANPSASGTVSGGGTIAENNTCTLNAIPNVGYNFVNWTENGTVVSTNPTYSFTVTGSRTLVANFEEWTLNVATNPSSTEGLAYGTQVTMTASTNIPSYNNYTFTQTSETFSSISGSPDGTSTSTGDGATFAFQLPFAFNLAGKDFAQGTTLTMRCDGYVSLGSPVYSSHTPSSPGSTYTMIAPFGYDQQLESTSKMYYKTTTENGAQVLIMEWNNMRSYSSDYNWANYQVKLYEGSNIVKFCYGSFTYGVTKTMYSYITADGRMTLLTSSYASPVVVTNTTGSTPSGIDVNSASTAPANGTVYTFAPFTYTWTYTGTEGTANVGTYTVTPTENSTYTVSVTVGGQTYTETVEVTMQALTKTIEAYTGERGGYYLIASPIGQVSPEDVTNMLSNDYDLYYFKQEGDAEGLEWINYESTNGDGGYDMMPGTGYLYANKQGTTLTFTGTPYNGNGEVTLSKKDCSNATGNFAGWNLVGNPFAQTAYFTNDFYTLNEDRDEVVAGTTKRVEAMEGIFVIATTNGEKMTFSTTPLGKSNSQMSINVVRNRGNVIDRAIVRFDEESLLPKFQLNPNHTKVYIPQDGSDYAVVYADGAGTMPVNFKAEKNGHYTLNFTTENVNFNYLHLIDNMTGNDVDLLQTPYYAFNAKSTDFASRFTLVFATGNDNDGNFAFFNNGVWIINNDGKAELQVVDALGRILSSETISGSCSKAINAAPGVYMLRLINGNDVKVQKVVVR